MTAASSSYSVVLAHNEDQISRCFSVMAELRPHLVESQFVPLVRSMQNDGYQLAFLEFEGAVKAVAGFRIYTKLSAGRLMYVDDLVTRASARSQGYGDAFFDWLLATAKEHHCLQLELDSGVQRFDAHRFYLRRRMKISSHHFALTVSEA